MRRDEKRIPRMSLRWKIAALVAAGACAAAGAVGVLVHQATAARLLSKARDNATRQLALAVTIETRTGSPSGSGATLDADRIPGNLRALVHRGRQGTASGEGPNGPAMWAARPVGDRILSVRVDMDDDVRNLQALDMSITLAALLTVAVVVPLGALSAERLSRKLRQAAETARRIADGDLDARIGIQVRHKDEIAEISTAVDSMAGALQERLRSEQRFTADVAHELRTPLMGLVTSAELLPPGEAAHYVQDRVQVLSALVEDLLEISRLDARAEEAELTPCPLSRTVEEAVRRTGLAAEVRPSDEIVVETDPRRLERIVANLVVNAHRHGCPPIRVAIEGSTVTVEDHGPGYPGELLADGPQRFRTGTRERGRGHGLGLTIALGQARVIGAELEFSNVPDGGARAVLQLPIHT
ncbi:ATP-binding protein [Streptomyces sp. NPDC002537]